MFALTTVLRRAPRSAARGLSLASRRTIISIAEPKYTATALATGAGRNGTVRLTSDDAAAPLNAPLALAMPPALGGPGGGANPEQLFAAGYAACFLSAIHAVGRVRGTDVSGATVHVKTTLGSSKEVPGFALGVEIEVGGITDAEIVQKAHEGCPYSRALQHGAKTVARLV